MTTNTRARHPQKQRNPNIPQTMPYPPTCGNNDHPHPPLHQTNPEPPTLQEALELRGLLWDPNLQTPIQTHCELHSLMFILHRAYRNLITDENQYPNKQQRKTLEANLIEGLHQIDALPFLRERKQTPQKFPRRTFCMNCYQLGHWKKDCPFYQCPHCKLHQPHHEEQQCLLQSLGPYGRPNTPVKQESPSLPPLSIQIPYQRGFRTKKPTTPLTSPTTLLSSNRRITKNKGKGKRKHYYTQEQRKAEREIDKSFDQIEEEWDRRIREFSAEQNTPHEYDDETLANIDGEPSGY